MKEVKAEAKEDKAEAKDDKAQDEYKEASPKASLAHFLKFCSENYPARHYMLFILGHGVVVGNDIFLFDEHAAQPSLKLKHLGDLLKKFADDIKQPRAGAENAATAQFELVGFHSCSMSSLEVAYELEGKANFLLASQGPAFVGSWPYRQILISVFNGLIKKDGRKFSDPHSGKAAVKELFTNIFAYCHFNSHDFLVAGYSYDMCLCDLNNLKEVRTALSQLTSTLREALLSGNRLARERILLAHWDAQSYWRENYTDLYDFCYCLRKRCLIDETDETKLLDPSLETIFEMCGGVMAELEKEAETSRHGGKRVFDGFRKKAGKTDDRVRAEHEKKDGEMDEPELVPKPKKWFIVRSDFTGPTSQYSNGMSVYFPWAAPIRAGFLKEYENYQFVQKYGDDKIPSWLDFLSTYFELTRRKTRATERGKGEQTSNLREKLVEEFAEFGLKEIGQLSDSKPGANSSTGDDYEYPSLKNHPPYLREPQNKVGKYET